MTPLELEELAEIIAGKVADRLARRPSLVDRTELSKIIGLSVPTIDRRRKTGEIPSISVGGRILFDPSAVIAALRATNGNGDSME